MLKRFLKVAHAAALLLLIACGSGAESQASRGGERPPIDPEEVRRDVEQHASWQELRKAACPRRILDLIEKRRPFPAIDLLERLQYATVTDDTSRGKYEKVIELTASGRQEFARHLEEEPERYIIAIARREYVPGWERFDLIEMNKGRVLVNFAWKWAPLNPLGERLNMDAPYGDRPEHQGRATYERGSFGWKLSELWLDRDNRDYVGGVFR